LNLSYRRDVLATTPVWHPSGKFFVIGTKAHGPFGYSHLHCLIGASAEQRRSVLLLHCRDRCYLSRILEQNRQVRDRRARYGHRRASLLTQRILSRFLWYRWKDPDLVNREPPSRSFVRPCPLRRRSLVIPKLIPLFASLYSVAAIPLPTLSPLL
jgi:hypothetical protein